MNNKKIKLITYITSSIFIILTILNIYSSQSKPIYSSLKTQLESNKFHHKNFQLNLKEIEYQNPQNINFDAAVASSQAFATHTRGISEYYPLHKAKLLKISQEITQELNSYNSAKSLNANALLILKNHSKIKTPLLNKILENPSLLNKVKAQSQEETLLPPKNPSVAPNLKDSRLDVLSPAGNPNSQHSEFAPKDASSVTTHPSQSEAPKTQSVPNIKIIANSDFIPQIKLAVASKQRLETHKINISALNERYYILTQNYLKKINDDESKDQSIRLYSMIALTTILIILVTFIVTLLKELDLLVINQEKTIQEKTAEATAQRNKAVEALESKKKFLSLMTHEIRNPLTSILGYIDILKNKLTIKENKKKIDAMHYQAEHLYTLLNNILDFSKLEEGKLKATLSIFIPSKEFKELTSFYKQKAKLKKVKFKLDYNKNVPYSIELDPVSTKQILFNLIDNAIKFTNESKKVTLHVDYDPQNQTLILAIQDEGIGIAQEKIQEILKPFSQENDDTFHHHGGTGLGLTISSQLAKLQGGSLSIASTKNQGSTFTVSIPSKTVQNTAPYEKPEVDVKKSPLHILVAEDDDYNLEYFKEALKETFGEDTVISTARDGQEALDSYSKNPSCITAILMDENMPNLTGSQVVEKIRLLEKAQNLSEVNIIGITATDEDDEIKTMLEAGYTHHISKPFKPQKLKKLIFDYESREYKHTNIK